MTWWNRLAGKGHEDFSALAALLMQWGEGLRHVFAQLPDPDWDLTAAS